MSAPVPLDQQIASVTRELALRRAVYPKQVSRGRMRQSEADHEIAAMEAVHATLTRLRAERLRGDATLFDRTTSA